MLTPPLEIAKTEKNVQKSESDTGLIPCQSVFL